MDQHLLPSNQISDARGTTTFGKPVGENDSNWGNQQWTSIPGMSMCQNWPRF